MNNYIGYKVILYPTNDQIQIFNKYFDTCRFVYNLAIDMQEDQYTLYKENNEEYSILSFYSLNNKFNKIKNSPEFEWLHSIDQTSLKLVLQDCCTAYEKFFNKASRHPRYKSKKRSKKQFPIRSERLKIFEDYAYIPSIGNIQCYLSGRDEIIGSGNFQDKISSHLKFTNPRISFDGVNYYLSFSLPKDEYHNIASYDNYGGSISYLERKSNEPIGIDLGCKKNNWIVDSYGNRISMPDYSKEDKMIKRLHKKLSRQLRTNNRETRLSRTQIQLPNGRTRNEMKTIAKLNKNYKRISNKRKDTIHKYCKSLLEIKPSSVVLEKIRVEDMLITNSDKICNEQKEAFNSSILRAALYTVQNIIHNTMEANNIPVIYAPEDYPSTKMCSMCGHIQTMNKKRRYICEGCGSIMDRDENAAINLAKLGYSV